MSRNKGHRYQGKSKPVVGAQAREVLENIDESNPVIKMFLEYRRDLDHKHDLHEKIVKMSRDITIENKRIIFLLHSYNSDIETKKQQVLDEAGKRLKTVVDENFRAIALALKGHDAYQYHRAYTSGLQEFVEALVFHQFLSNSKIESYDSLEKSFHFKDEDEDVGLLLPHNDFILGITDFTGELMRRCINNLGCGNINECFTICNFVKEINTGFLGVISPGNKELSRKLYVLRQSLSKMELVCYNIQIRGSEVPKHMLASVIESSNDMQNDDDEGFY